MERRTQIDNKGFSLVELIVCLAISTFVILAAYSLVLVGTRSYHSNNKNVKVQKEVTFTTNLIADNIRNAKIDKTLIKYINTTGNDIELHTGERVICYDKSEKSLFIYEETPSADYWPASYDNKNLISKYVEAFNVEFVSPDSRNLNLPTGTPKTIKAIEAVTDGTNNGSTNLIKFTIDFNVNGKKDSTQVIYQIRN